MAEVVDVKTFGYQPAGEEELPVRGFLFKGKRLIGVYTKEALIPVTYDTDENIERGILKGNVRPRMLLRTYQTETGTLYDVVLVSGFKSWHIASFTEPLYPPPEST